MDHKRIGYRAMQVIGALAGISLQNSRFEKEKFEGILEGKEGIKLADKTLGDILSGKIKSWTRGPSYDESIRNPGGLDDSYSSDEIKCFHTRFECFIIKLKRHRFSGHNAWTDSRATYDSLEVLKESEVIGSLVNGKRISDAYEFLEQNYR